MKRLFLITLSAELLMFASVAISYSQYTVIRLTNNAVDDFGAELDDNGSVVWAGCDGGKGYYGFCTGDTELFLYDGASTTQLTNNFSGEWTPKINDMGPSAVRRLFG